MASNRYLALDAFRGLTIALMILVNTPGSWAAVYAPLLHADWHGITPTDLIFPFFLFIIGSALYFSLAKTNFECNRAAIFCVIKRAAIIVTLGILLNAYGHHDPLSELRLMGVLQRLGIAYGVAATLVLTLKPKPLICVAILMLLGYWLFLLLAPVGEAFTLSGNIVRQFDLKVLGENHLWQGKGLAFEPEGLLSTIPAVVNVLIGFAATQWLTGSQSKRNSIIELATVAVVMIGLALMWSQALPINKSLWTSSYVLFSSGCSLLVLVFFIWLVDIKKQVRLVNPLLVYGTNPMFIYVLSWLWVSSYYLIDIPNSDGTSVNLNHYLYLQINQLTGENLASLIFALLHVVLFWLISKVLHSNNIIVKV
ncbi:MAG: DUF1624 domain-containing protein [Gammaproteobacteria bacterium]|nr:DUF1624 domain-containing protein [Gammaproteobacteria bacterium]